MSSRTPGSNHGGTHDKGGRKLKSEVLVDWLTFSVKNATEPKEVIRQYLGMDPELFQDAGYSLLGYDKVLRFGDICVCYEPRENGFFKDMGICVSMSGNGCREFETMSRLSFEGAQDKQGMESIAFPVLFQLLTADENAHISRLDIACDDRQGHLDMSSIIRKVQENEVNSRMTRRSVVVAYDGAHQSGATAYIGAPSSDFRIRIYDKALEEGVSGHWIRVEMVLRGDHANAFVAQLTVSDTVGKLAAQVLNDKLAFIERDDSNISRCTVTDWWAAFVSELESVKLVARKVIRHSVERISNWVEAQVGPSLAVLARTLGFAHILEIALGAGERLSNRQRSLIADYNSLQTSLA